MPTLDKVEERPERGASGLLAEWRARKPGQLTVDRYRELGKRANAMGESLIACDIAAEALKNWAEDVELWQIKALALARMGSREQAQEILLKLRNEAHDDVETLGLLARIYKDLWLATGDPKDLKLAHAAYAEAYKHSPQSYWVGINAATLAFAMDKRGLASTLVAQLRQFCLEALKTASGDAQYWLTATLAEASLVLGDIAEAEHRYAEASKIARSDLGNLASTWRNARIILDRMSPEVRNRIQRAINVPKVIVFAGHRVDTPGREPPRFPEVRAPEVKAVIKERLREANAGVGYSSAARGSDILFLEAMQAIGGRTHIVLPCHEEQFIQESVAGLGGDWVERFRNVVRSADELILASSERLRLGGIAYDYSNQLLHGLASLRAQQFDADLVCMAVWDGEPGDGPGGTADIVQRWRDAGLAVNIIDSRDPIGAGSRAGQIQSGHNATSKKVRLRSKVRGLGSEIRAMIFADAYHFSSLAEEQIPSFTRHFMGSVATLANGPMKSATLYQNTWGDGLFFVFETVADAGRFALKLADRVASIDRMAVGLPEDLSLRIALHAGPVYRFKDRIIRKPSYIGSHVNRAARIEPVTPPGQIYASDAFAALAALEAPHLFRFEYVGRIPLAKSFGEFPMYRLRKR